MIHNTLLLIALFISLVSHSAEITRSITGVSGPFVHEFNDTELKQFGDNCYRLPYPLWVNVLDFLLGSNHDVHYTIDPAVITDLYRNNKAKIDDGGRLVSCYNNHVYSWSPHGKHVAKKAWRTRVIRKGWVFDRIEHGSVVLLNDSHDEIRVLNDTSFKTQARYSFPKNSYFHVTNRGQTMFHCAHPLLPSSGFIAAREPGSIIPVWHKTYSAIKKIHMVHYNGGQQVINMPDAEAMPPITCDETGKLLVAHSARADAIHVFDLATVPRRTTPLEIELSQRSIDIDSINYAGWVLIHPEHSQPQDFMSGSYIYPFPRHVRFVYHIRHHKEHEKHYPFAPCYFYQDQTFTGDLTIQSNKTPHIISLSQTPSSYDEDEKTSSSVISINHFDGTNGEKVRSTIVSEEKAGIATYAISKTNKLVLCAGKTCYISTSDNNIRTLASSHYHQLYRQDALISPSGHWVLRYERVKESDGAGFMLPPLQVFYLGGERMKNIMTEDPKINRRKLMMRLYALQRASELGEHVKPPVEMQERIGMRTNNVSQQAGGTDTCIIS